MSLLIEVSMVIPTRNRENILERTLISLGRQDYQPDEIIIVDASEDFKKQRFAEIGRLKSKVVHVKAEVSGAAQQRNQGVALASNSIIGFMDDDIIFESECIKKLWEAINSDVNIGGCNAMIINQKYQQPGKISSFFYSFFLKKEGESFAGKCIGPAINFLPADSEDLPEINEVDWLNTTFVFYKKEFLNIPPFEKHFRGYSLMEDLTLSLRVAQRAKLFNVRTARIFHDSQPGTHKEDIEELSKMELVNRYYIMKHILDKKLLTICVQLFLQQSFSIISNLRNFKMIKILPSVLLGKLKGISEII